MEDDKISFRDVKRQFISSEPVGNSCKLGGHQVHQVIERSMRVKYISVVRKENKMKQRRRLRKVIHIEQRTKIGALGNSIVNESEFRFMPIAHNLLLPLVKVTMKPSERSGKYSIIFKFS